MSHSIISSMVVGAIAFLSIIIVLLSSIRKVYNESPINYIPNGSIIGTSFGSYMCTVVSCFTRSEYNHVGIVYDDYVYDVLNGKNTVSKTPIDKWIAKNNNVVVLKYKGDIDLGPIIMDKYEVHNKKRRRYNITKWTALLFNVDKSSDNETYCSKFVIDILHDAGIISNVESNLLPSKIIHNMPDNMSLYYMPAIKMMLNDSLPSARSQN